MSLDLPFAPPTTMSGVWWRVLVLVGVGFALMALRACERYTSEYQTLPALDWLESRPPLAEAGDLPTAMDLVRGLLVAQPLLVIRDDARPYAPGLGPPSLSRRTMGGVRDAAVIQLATPELTRPRVRVTLRVAVFFRALRAAAWASLLDHEFGLRDPGTGTAQLRVSGADDGDRVWVTQPGDASGGESTVIGARGPVAFQLQAQTQLPVPPPPDSGSTPDMVDLSARAERIARQAAADWTAWLEQQPSLRPR